MLAYLAVSGNDVSFLNSAQQGKQRPMKKKKEVKSETFLSSSLRLISKFVIKLNTLL